MKKFILIVDDSATIRSSVEYVLSQAGYDVMAARDGLDGIDKLEAIAKAGDSVSMIISDINMPGMDGIKFTETVKKGAFSRVPVLILTTESQESKKLKGKAAGAAGWLVKPFQPEQLLAVVKKLAH